MRLTLPIALLFLPALAFGAEPPKPPPATVPEPPPLPANYQPSETPEPGAIEPEITITTRDGDQFEEYRVNGRLYMVKVTPAKGPPYYLIDDEGTGKFRRSDLEREIAPPLWVIKRF
jgi:hypothetical protein